MQKKIYVHVIDGTGVWMPVTAEQLENGQFLIGAFEEFDPNDSSIIPQFIPGDIVTCKRNRNGQEEFEAADFLIKPSEEKAKNYFEFLYAILTGENINHDANSAKYRDAINRIRMEINEGKSHYAAVVNYIKRT